MKTRGKGVSIRRYQATELRKALAGKIALAIGSAENQATAIPGLTLHRRTSPTARCSMTEEPSVTVIAQGRKRVELGRNIFIYDSSRFLLTSTQREIIYRILRSAEGTRLRAIATLGEQTHRTAKAIAWIRENYAKRLRVEDLAEIAAMGVSRLHHHFGMLTAMSPLRSTTDAGYSASSLAWRSLLESINNPRSTVS